jgi:pyruvate/oxaloacetate carboxyltransferase
MRTTYTSNPVEITNDFAPASQSLASGIAKEAMMDISRLLRYLGQCLLEVWLDATYNTAIYLQELKEGWQR